MTILRDIQLDRDWRCTADEDALICRAGFWLDPLDACARYLLRLKDVGQPCRLTLGALTAEVGAGSTELDVTEYVMLEDNVLNLIWPRVDSHMQPPVGAVWLQAVACEDSAGEAVLD